MSPATTSLEKLKPVESTRPFKRANASGIEVPATMTVFGFCNTLLCAGKDPLTKLYWNIEYEHLADMRH